MTRPGTIAWFARHELLLVWRDWMGMMTAGRSARERLVAAFVVVMIIGLHGLAYAVLRAPLAAGIVMDKHTLVALGGTLALSISLMLSQALESVTRAFYVRADLDLILSSPTSARRLFAVRITAIAFSTSSLSLFLGAPFINVAAALDGSHWLAAYPAIFALSAIATAVALVMTVAMFRTIGPRHTRLVAQVVAAVVGAGFLIGTQVAAILYFGSYSRTAFMNSDAVAAALPDAASLFWLPVRALLGDPASGVALAALGVAALAGVISAFAGNFGGWVVQAASVAEMRRKRGADRPFHVSNARQALRIKEWQLLRRDPWLLSQSLMQVLYLIPPGVLLWQKFGDAAGALIILVPILVMAIGQLAGGLAWLAVSGEDAADLIGTAPLPRGAVMVAKVEALLMIIGVIAAPFILVIALINPWVALMTAGGAALASASAVAIQLWHKTESRRNDFRRRQTASRAATFCEAFSSIMWSGTALLAAAGMWHAAIFGATAIAVLVIAWLMSVRSAS